MALDSVSTNAVWGYTLSSGKSPVTTADTTAELGCKPWRWAKACVCRVIRPATDWGVLSCAAGPCCHHGAQDREAAKLPGRFCCRTALTALLSPVSSMIDKVLPSGVSAADRGWQIPRSSWESIYKKAQKQLSTLLATVSLFVPLFLRLFLFRK